MFHRQQNLKIFVLLHQFHEQNMSAWKFHEKTDEMQQQTKK